MAPSAKKPQQQGHKKSPVNKKELLKKNLNVSAGRVFYEKASSRRIRHRDVLNEHSHDAVPLKRSSSITSSKKRRVFSDAEEEEERIEQAGRLRFSKIAWAGGRRRPSTEGGSTESMRIRETPSAIRRRSVSSQACRRTSLSKESAKKATPADKASAGRLQRRRTCP
jgi:hypothetical protein